VWNDLLLNTWQNRANRLGCSRVKVLVHTYNTSVHSFRSYTQSWSSQGSWETQNLKKTKQKIVSRFQVSATRHCFSIFILFLTTVHYLLALSTQRCNHFKLNEIHNIGTVATFLLTLFFVFTSFIFIASLNRPVYSKQ